MTQLACPAAVSQVAKCILRGAERGDYHVHGPDVGLNCLVASMAGFSPRMYHWVLEMILAPVMTIVAAVGTWAADRTVRRHAASIPATR